MTIRGGCRRPPFQAILPVTFCVAWIRIIGSEYEVWPKDQEEKKSPHEKFFQLKVLSYQSSPVTDSPVIQRLWCQRTERNEIWEHWDQFKYTLREDRRDLSYGLEQSEVWFSREHCPMLSPSCMSKPSWIKLKQWWITNLVALLRKPTNTLYIGHIEGREVTGSESLQFRSKSQNTLID